MTAMAKRTFIAVVAVVAVVATMFAACGGSDADPNAGKGQRITDPARVPSSTPIQNPVLYQIRSDGRVDSSGGPPITIPTTATPASTTSTYTVVSGDTCGAITEKFKTTLDALRKANRTIDDSCSNLHAGDVLKIPSAAPATTPAPGATAKPGGSGKTYTVASGDTCGSIAASFGVTSAALISANGIDADCKTLKIGQTLTIPAS